jgi:general secretion pathway protein A
MRQFAQRVMASYHLVQHGCRNHRGLRPAPIASTLVVREKEFTARRNNAMIHKYSDGVPRLVNKYADFAMVYAASSDLNQVDEATVGEVVADGLFMVPGDAQKDAAE